jgi:hypothetical protein
MTGVDVATGRRLRANSGHSQTVRRTGQVDPERPFKIGPMNGRHARESGLWPKAWPPILRDVLVHPAAFHDLASALTQTKGAAEVSPPFVEPTMNLGDSDGGRPRGAVVAESFECVCALDWYRAFREARCR